uniref:Nibrin n=1 Tax=Lepisosteus oculatus TaxID=7918 RepID=W5MW35_LEPOC
GHSYSLLPGVEYVVGRKNCPILLQNDQSISRLHAVVSSQSFTLPTLTVKDTSKYGTYVNDERLSCDTPKVLQPGDRVTFGVFHSKFKVENEPMVVCSSCLDSEGKAALSQSVQLLGGRVVHSWSQECTHLVMPSVKVTIKTICALLCCRPIVTPEYFRELRKAVQLRQQPPEPAGFYPPIEEPSISPEELDLSARPNRKTLFQDKIFVFLNVKQHKRLGSAVAFGGGQARLLEEGAVPLPLLASAGTCVIEVGEANSQVEESPFAKKWMDSIARILQRVRNGLRFISEAEIGLAAVYVATNMYCNPASRISSEAAVTVKPALPSATQSVAVDETVMSAGTLNITAYAQDTGPSQTCARMDTSGEGLVTETPEKQQRGERSSWERAAVKEASGTCTVAESVLADWENEGGQARYPPDPSRATVDNHLTPNKTPSASGSRADSSQSQARPLTLTFVPSCILLKKVPINCQSRQVKLKTPYYPHDKSDTDTSIMQKKFGISLVKHSCCKKKTTKQIACRDRDNDPTPGLPQAKQVRLTGAEHKASGSSVPQRSDPVKNHPPSPAPSESFLTKRQSAEETQVMTDCGAGTSKDSELARGSGDANQKSTSRKRKDMTPDCAGSDAVISEAEMEELASIMSEPMDEGQDFSVNASKKQKLEPAVKVKQEELSVEENNNKSEVLKPVSQEPVEQERDIKYKISALKKQTDDFPRNLIVTEFKSLLVIRPTRATADLPQSSNVNGKNFKKFRKVAFPGTAGLPKIIGGSDLVPHQTKNSELEEWFRQEVVAKSQYEKEDSIADDIFRYAIYFLGLGQDVLLSPTVLLKCQVVELQFGWEDPSYQPWEGVLMGLQ